MNDSLAAIERVLTRGLSTPTAGSLQLIGTPLGNLGDLSLRAIDTLGNLDCLYCEDTRTTASLLRVLGFRVELRSLTDHNEATRRPEILASLSEGARIGLVSEAGLPLVSDPGEGLVQAVIEAGFPVSVVPGPSAPSLALVGSGLPMTPHLFAGFPPRKAGALRSYLDSTLGPWTTIFFESPKRVENLLLTLSGRIPADGQIVVARELTKQFETYHRGSGASPPTGPFKGECVVLVGPTPLSTGEPDDLVERVNQLLDAGLGPKSVCQVLAGLAPKKRLYSLALKRS
ncbi:MAG TPA: 16S rRNA (cytidine(1402)-2'-O)-methyltransferase [Myxococcales bacterium]|nr:16S rRNA (cytidine(1402)-2'-O)-methyltransferase [Myxococcales bacterium]|tara:strand:- start:1234 stop:2094 length:861 start_codon:yes stop_codon:yes gene_type:complete